MSIKLKIAWILSILATAVACVGVVGDGTWASFSDTVTVRHEIQTGHVKVRIVKVDGKALDSATDARQLSDVVNSTNADITRVIELRNDGNIDVTSLFLTTTPAKGDSTDLAKALSVAVQLTDKAGTTKATRTLADWETAPQELKLPSTLAPGESLTITMHTNGTLDVNDNGGVEPTYAFTAYANE